MTQYDFQIGVDKNHLTNVESVLGAPPHPWQYHRGSTDPYTGGNGQTYIDGYPWVKWHFEYVSDANWATLMGWFAAAQSVLRSLKTKNDAGSYVNVRGYLQRPVVGDDVERGVGGWFNVTLRFTRLESDS